MIFEEEAAAVRRAWTRMGDGCSVRMGSLRGAIVAVWSVCRCVIEIIDFFKRLLRGLFLEVLRKRGRFGELL